MRLGRRAACCVVGGPHRLAVAERRRQGFVPALRDLQATHEKTLEHVDLETLMLYAIDAEEAKGEVERIDDLRDQLNKSIRL